LRKQWEGEGTRPAAGMAPPVAPSTSIVIPAQAGISGPEVTDLRHETPASAGVTSRAGLTSAAGMTNKFEQLRALLPSARNLTGEPAAASPDAAPHRRPYGARSLPRLFVILAPAMLLAACATQVSTGVQPQAPGFLLGLWHGFIFPVAWIASLFIPDAAVYAVPNNGGWYDFGFFIGIVFLGVGAHGGTRRRRRR
jgi:hypothetical protein